MPQKNETPSFFEPRTIIAIIAVAGIYFGWQTYLKQKYPSYGKPVAIPAETKTIGPDAGGPQAQPARNAEVKQEEIKNSEEKLFPFDSEKLGFTLTSRGMGLKNVTVNNYTDKDKNKIALGVSDTDSLFEMKIGDAKPLEFNVVEQAPGHYIGTAQVGEMTIRREISYDPKSNAFTNLVNIAKPNDEVLKGISFIMPDTVRVAPAKSFLLPSYEHQDFVVIYDGGSSKNVPFSSAKEDLNKEFKTTTLVGMGSQYFAAAILDKSTDMLPDLKVTSNVAAKTAAGSLIYKPATAKADFAISQIYYAGPKSLDNLKAIDPELPRIIDFGFFGMISRPLVSVMKAFYSVVGNWGLAIIMLTLLVRLCVLPFNIMSIRSMKAMQKIQPKLQALREKYKSDPTTMNRETMALMKQNGANPLGGCLPMLIQIPVFFALYRVIGSSIELYHSPFIFWITDLSSHDRFYVLPVLMGIAMFLQQKLTPSTMDPTQAKVMMFLPIVFSLFMLQLPSGLTLYMFVSTLFGVTQQYFIMKDRSKDKVLTVKA